jgi:hypothetical protein
MKQAFSLPLFVHVYPGCYPGLVCDEPFGLVKGAVRVKKKTA